jgi:threonine/homoserine/homoserine lactone efflux protein
LAASAARSAVGRAEVQRVVNRVGGGLLIGAGLFAVTWRKAAG